MAYVAVAELPVGQWNDLIPVLVENVVNLQSTELKKEATLEAIGLYFLFQMQFNLTQFHPAL